ncbi:MAG: hypothetical protein NTZ05_14530, partial [Chloroflexi bacterium]|nr:hypothetical protein [Chloroflexota bacterium]
KPVTILVGITNREGREIHYLLNARTSGQELGVQQQVTVADGSRWQGPITFTLPPAAGPDEVSVELVLRRENAPADYRVLRLWLGPA